MIHNRFDWPDCYPNGCPPESCSEEVITVYRYVKDAVLDNNDFAMYGVEKPHEMAKYNPNQGMEYLTLFSISTFDSESALRSAAKSTGFMRKLAKEKPFIAKGDTREGVYLFEPPEKHHIELWLKRNSQPHTYFEVIGKIE